MSNRYAPRRNDAARSPNTKQKYVAVTSHNNSESSSSNQSFSTSVRNPSTSFKSADDVGGGLGSRIRMGENGDWVRGQGGGGGSFVNYLPQDEAVAIGLGAEEGGLDPIESQRVVDLLNRELCRLLKLNARDFWTQVASDTTLHEFLDSFLHFRHRWYDFPQHKAKGVVAGVIVGEEELCRRVLMVLYRMSSNRDPGAKASVSLSPNDHTVLLRQKKLLDLPKLLDICAIYGHENRDIVASLVNNAFKAQPMIYEDSTAVMSQFISIILTMKQRCNSSLEVLLTSGSFADHKPSRLHADYLEVMDFINDSISTMDSLVSLFKPATILFSCTVELSSGNEELLRTLASLHDTLLPCLLRGFQMIYVDPDSPANGGTLSEIAFCIKMLSNNLVKFAWNLLDACYLSDEVFKSGHLPPESTKMFPAMVEDSAIRGDILIQTLREVNDNMPSIELNHNIGTFLQNMDQNHSLVARIEALQNEGWISLENEQLHFLFGITMHEQRTTVNSVPSRSNFTNVSVGKLEEDTAIIESKISQIKDLFPDCGKGFLSACLEVYNNDPEEVIQRILEGTLHEDLQLIDTTLDEVPTKTPAASVGKMDKGKGILVEPTEPFVKSSPSVTNGNRLTETQSTSSSYAGRFVRKSKVGSKSSTDLDSRDERDMAKTAALVSQYEYDDEYDDSFDDLGLSVGDSGLEENESFRDKLSLKPEDSNPSNSAKWGSRKKPQFYVKDGKNYSYKVEGAVAVANTSEASIVNQAQKEMIHGLGRGGNLPLGAVKKLTETYIPEKIQDHQSDGTDNMGRGRGFPRGRGRRGGRGNAATGERSEGQSDQHESVEMGGRGNSGFSPGRGRGGDHNHHRRDRAMKKHFGGLSGY